MTAGVAHLLIDAVSGRLKDRETSAATHLFLGNHLAHLLVVLVAWSLPDASAWTGAPVVTALGG